MAILNVRRLPDETHAQLRLRAARNGHSMEAEARDILRRACAAGYDPAEGSSTIRDADPKALTITLTPEQADAARAHALEHGTTLESYVRQVLDRDLAADSTAQVDELFSLMDDAGGNLQGQTWTRDELYRG